MSEYQYYEFRALDKPLSERQMTNLRKLSTRAEITPTSFINEYHWGDFRGDPRQMMEKYFDAFLYYANWGTHWFMLRLPRKLVNLKNLKQYCTGDSCRLRTKGDYVMLDFQSEDESEEGEEDWDSNWLAALIPLRANLLDGDPRCLYLGWLASVQSGELDEDKIEPIRPPGLKHLTASLRDMADFLRIDSKLLEIATAADASKAPAAPSRTDLSRWIDSLSSAEKNQILLHLLQNDTPCLRERLLNRFRQTREKKSRSKTAKSKTVKRRTVGELLAAAGLRNQ